MGVEKLRFLTRFVHLDAALAGREADKVAVMEPEMQENGLQGEVKDNKGTVPYSVHDDECERRALLSLESLGWSGEDNEDEQHEYCDAEFHGTPYVDGKAENDKTPSQVAKGVGGRGGSHEESLRFP